MGVPWRRRDKACIEALGGSLIQELTLWGDRAEFIPSFLQKDCVTALSGG